MGECSIPAVTHRHPPAGSNAGRITTMRRQQDLEFNPTLHPSIETSRRPQPQRRTSPWEWGWLVLTM